MLVQTVSLKEYGDWRGDLVAIEEYNDIPFHIKRVYYIFNTAEAVVRGKHAHKKLQQILVCIHGACKVLLDDGKTQEIVQLDSPFKGLYIDNAIWREMFDFSPDTVLLVLASELYDESDYIRNYDDFLDYVNAD